MTVSSSCLLQHHYAEIVDWYKDLAESKYPDIVKFIPSIGKSLEGRDQPAVHITGLIDPEKPKDKKIYFQCQIHASE